MPKFFLLLSILVLAGCGTPGAPLPPSLDIPKAIRDLKAVRKGDVVTLTWTAPQNTTDGALLKHTGKMKVQRELITIGEPASSSTTLNQLTLPPGLKNQKSRNVTATDSLAQMLAGSAQPDFAAYTVEALNDSGKSAGLSNQSAVPLVTLPPTPAAVSLDVAPAGVSISWTQRWTPVNHTRLKTQYLYRVMRRLAGAKEAVLVSQVYVGNEALKVIDTGIVWEKQYEYWLVPVTQWEGNGQKGEIEGTDSAVETILAHDIFPPAVPSGLQAVFSGVTQQPFIDLTWSPNNDAELAGYNIYRRTEGTQPVKINQDLVKAPAFRDPAVKAGTKYFYSVSAVDLRNNESAKSQETSETVPDQR
jgi:hypothetical protein